jgi:hypothetical protein
VFKKPPSPAACNGTYGGLRKFEDVADLRLCPHIVKRRFEAIINFSTGGILHEGIESTASALFDKT